MLDYCKYDDYCVKITIVYVQNIQEIKCPVRL